MADDRKHIFSTLQGIESVEKRIDQTNLYAEKVFRSNFSLSKELAELALDQAQNVDYQYGIARALINNGYILNKLNSNEKAIHLFQQALALLHGIEKGKHYLLRAYDGIGITFMGLGEYGKSLEYLTKGLGLSRSFGDLSMEVRILGTIAILEVFQQRYESSLTYNRQALTIAKDLNDQEQTRRCLNNMGAALIELKRYDEALDCLSESLDLAKKLGYPVSQAATMDEISKVYHAMGKLDDALEMYQKVWSIYMKEGVTQYEPELLLHIGNLLIDKGEIDQAEHYLTRLRDLAQNIHSLAILRDAYNSLAKLAETRKDFTTALSLFRKYHEISERIQNQEAEKELKKIEAESYKQANARIRIISEIGQRITASLKLQDVLEILYNNVNEIMDASVFGIALYYQSSRTISFEMFVEKGVRLKPDHADVNDHASFAAWCIRNSQDIVINDMEYEFSRYVSSVDFIYNTEEQSPEDPKSLLFTPLRKGNTIIGVMTVQSFKSHAYSSQDIDSFKALSTFVAIALSNAKQAELIEQQNRELKQLAGTDSLTGLKNRRSFELELDNLMSLSKRKDFPLSLLLMDLDHFKNINDTFGHPSGDRALKKMAHAITPFARRATDCIARYGGEEFMVLLDDTNLSNARQIAERIRSKVEAMKITFGKKRFHLTVSIGVSCFIPLEKPDETPKTLISRADKALYLAKQRGRNRVEVL